jgi:hypothetical protein
MPQASSGINGLDPVRAAELGDSVQLFVQDIIKGDGNYSRTEDNMELVRTLAANSGAALTFLRDRCVCACMRAYVCLECARAVECTRVDGCRRSLMSALQSGRAHHDGVAAGRPQCAAHVPPHDGPCRRGGPCRSFVSFACVCVSRRRALLLLLSTADDVDVNGMMMMTILMMMMMMMMMMASMSQTIIGLTRQVQKLQQADPERLVVLKKTRVTRLLVGDDGGVDGVEYVTVGGSPVRPVCRCGSLRRRRACLPACEAAAPRGASRAHSLLCVFTGATACPQRAAGHWRLRERLHEGQLYPAGLPPGLD